MHALGASRGYCAVLPHLQLQLRPRRHLAALTRAAPPLPPRSLPYPASKVNPAGTVPSLADASGKVVCTSSRGIVELVDGLGDGPLGGKGADRALVASWIDKFDK